VVGLVARGIDSATVNVRCAVHVGGQTRQGSAVSDGAVEVSQAGSVDVECECTVQGFVKGDIAWVCAGECRIGTE